MQTLRKKTSPLKYKNETSRFLGEGVSFKAKLIGILEVSEARGDRMCQEALSDLKTAIRAAGEHKQRITINIAIDGLRLRDEKTGDSLYHHPVHKISFIAQDMTDSRAFGYIFGSPDTGHRFFGIKTDKAASQVVIAMRDLFQVVFALKKKEIELAKQHLDKNRYGPSPLFSETSMTSSKQTHGTALDNTKTSAESKTSSSERPTPAVADLVDLELELNSLQQGLHQMERITPSDPYGSKDDPFGDSFTPFPNFQKPILPPPPSSGRDRSSRSSETSSVFSPKTPHTGDSVQADGAGAKEMEFNISHDEPSSGDWFTPTASLFEDPPLVPEPVQDQHEITKKEILSQFDVFTDLDPLDPFGEDPFVKTDPFAEATFTFTESSDSVFNSAEQFNKNNFLPKGTSPLFKPPNTGVMQLHHENPSLDLSSESECAPEPPPRPTNNLAAQIKPPPLPPKKQAGEICMKPPPRPPHSEDTHYDFMDNYETAPNSLEYIKNNLLLSERSPPLPVPARKTAKKFNDGDDEDYLTPVTFTAAKTKNEIGGVVSQQQQILLPPPQKSNRKTTSTSPSNLLSQVTVASYLESKPNIITTSTSGDNKNSLDGLNITLSQLTLSGLNQLASKLNIPATQLSNMTLVQLTNFLSNFVKNNTTELQQKTETEDSDAPPFQADFANFNNFNETYDRYAVFRELLKEEIKQTKIDSEPREITEQSQTNNNNANDEIVIDKYAALREIVEVEVKQNEKSIEENDRNDEEEEEEEDEEEEEEEEKNNLDEQIENEANIINTEKFLDQDKEKDKIIEYDKSPVKVVAAKSPEIVQNNERLNSGSLSDVISGSSPEIDNTGSASEVAKKDNDTTGESWAIFDQPNPTPDKQQNIQSEEGVSPWSSDSKEFGNGSPPEWRPRIDSGSGDEQWGRRRRDQEGWWDTSAEPEVQYYPPPNRNRSTDSYEDECYACYDQPPRRRRHWSSHVRAGGGHSSSSRDVSPWEEEPNRRQQMCPLRHGRFDSSRHKDRRHTDSWDEEDDFEYEEEHPSRFHWQDRHSNHRETENREERWAADDWGEERKHRRRREIDRERWCCPDWDQGETDAKPPSRYSSGRWSDVPPIKWRERKQHEERYYSRDSQDSPWEDEYPNEPDVPHYLTAKRNWKQRPSSASEMERKSGELKPRQYNLGTGKFFRPP